MQNNFENIFKVLVYPILFFVCFALIPIFIFFGFQSFNDFSKLENGDTETVLATVVAWKKGNTPRKEDANTRYPYTLKYQFIPKHLPQIEENIVDSSTFRAVSKKLWDKTTKTKKIEIYYLIDNPKNNRVVGSKSPISDMVTGIVILCLSFIFGCYIYIKKLKIFTVEGFKKSIGWTAFLALFSLDKLTNLKAYRDGESIAEKLLVKNRYCEAVQDLMSYDTDLQIKAIQDLQQLAKLGQSLDHNILKILAAYIKNNCYYAYESHTQTQQPKSKLDKFLLAIGRSVKDLSYRRAGHIQYTHETVTPPISGNEIESYAHRGKTIQINSAIQEALNTVGRLNIENQAKINLSDLVFQYYVFSGNYSGINFKKSIFDNAVCKGALFSNCNLQQSSFRHANCQNAKFIHADCLDANFQASNCERADFTGANHSKSNFSEANIDGAIFE